jgi:predicted PurR-regulated permease PerM
MLAIVITYALAPIVNWLHQWRIPRALGAAVLLLGIVSGIGSLAYTLSDDAAALIQTLPEAAQNFRRTLHKQGMASANAIGSVQQAANQLERAANESAASATAAASGVTRVQIERPKLNIQDYLWTGTLGAAAAAGEAFVVLFLVYFLLIAGDTFRRKIVKITGSTLSEKRITVEVLDEITSQVQRFLLVQVAAGILVGVATFLAFLWIGLDHAAIWGVAAAVFHTIPYVGPVLVTGGTALVALLQFGTLGKALLVVGVSLVINSLVGFLLIPWLTSRASRMNAVTVFVGVLFWGWLWGVWGLLLGVPIIMMVKAVCDRVEHLKPVGELLGD